MPGANARRLSSLQADIVRRYPAGVATAADPVIGHIEVVIAAAARHVVAAKRAGLVESDPEAAKALDIAADAVFAEVQRFLSDRRPTTVAGAAALLDFALSEAGTSALPIFSSDGAHFMRRLMRVCADALADTLAPSDPGEVEGRQTRIDETLKNAISG